MKLTMLGTGNAGVTECYHTCFVLSDNARHFLVDGGGGNTVLTNLKKAGIDWKEIRDIFVTHTHIDHLLGIIWMMRMICQTMYRNGYEGEVRIYGHDRVLAMIKELSDKLLSPKHTGVIGERVHLIEVKDSETLEIIGHPTTFFDVCSTKEKQFGFTMELAPGENLTCCGDEPYRDCEERFAAGSKWLLHEAFCLYTERERFQPYKKHHSTVKDACESAEKLRVKNLVLYHTEDNALSERKRLYTEEGAKYYHGNLFVPDDLEVIDLS